MCDRINAVARHTLSAAVVSRRGSGPDMCSARGSPTHSLTHSLITHSLSLSLTITHTHTHIDITMSTDYSYSVEESGEVRVSKGVSKGVSERVSEGVALRLESREGRHRCVLAARNYTSE